MEADLIFLFQQHRQQPDEQIHRPRKRRHGQRKSVMPNPREKPQLGQQHQAKHIPKQREDRRWFGRRFLVIHGQQHTGAQPQQRQGPATIHPTQNSRQNQKGGNQQQQDNPRRFYPLKPRFHIAPECLGVNHGHNNDENKIRRHFFEMQQRRVQSQTPLIV